jgi:hypothetical protein
MPVQLTAWASAAAVFLRRRLHGRVTALVTENCSFPMLESDLDCQERGESRPDNSNSNLAINAGLHYNPIRVIKDFKPALL